MKKIKNYFKTPIKGVLDIVLIMAVTILAVVYLGPVIIQSHSGSNDTQKEKLPQFEYVCDETGRLIKDTLVDDAGNIYGWINIKYHENGKFSEIIETNERDRKIRNVFYSEEGEFLHWYEIEYDEKGAIISKMKFDQFGNRVIEEYEGHVHSEYCNH